MAQPDDQRSLKVLHGALCVGCLMFLLVLIYLDRMNGPTGNADLKILAVPGLATLILIPLSFFIFRKRIQQPRSAVAISPIAELRAALIIHWALIGSACFANAVLFLLTGSWIAYAAAWIALVILISRAPTERRIDTWITVGLG